MGISCFIIYRNLILAHEIQYLYPLYVFKKNKGAIFLIAPLKKYCFKNLVSEIVEVDIFFFNTKVVKHFVYSIGHGAGTTHVVFNIFGRFVIF